jgi:hypothetical protein
MERTPRIGNTMAIDSHEKAPNSTNSPRKRIVLPLRATGKKITRPDSIIPKRRWNIRIRLLSCRKKLIEGPKSQQDSNKQLFSRIAPFE